MLVSAPKPFDYLVFIGRFQPFHIAHQEVINIALTLSQNVILVLGSAQNERSLKNPFSAGEREQMIRGAYPQAQQQYLHFVSIIDFYDDVKWTKAVTDGVNALVSNDSKVGLIGHFKDESSYYLRLFPTWRLVELENLKNALSATPLREQYYQGEIDRDKFPVNVQEFLADFQKNDIYPKLQQKFKQQDKSILDK